MSMPRDAFALISGNTHRPPVSQIIFSKIIIFCEAMCLNGWKPVPLDHLRVVHTKYLHVAQLSSPFGARTVAVQRLRNITRFDPRFESSWYGPYNALLSHYFPYQQQFLIKPQAKFRATQEADVSFSSVQAEPSVELDGPPDEDSLRVADLSMNSMGFLALTSSGSTFIPDFIVAKATQFATLDTPLLVVEIKLEESTDKSVWVTYQNQVDEYMGSIANQMSGNTPLVICGTKVKIFRLESPRDVVKMDKVTRSINGKTVGELLLKIATDNWQY